MTNAIQCFIFIVNRDGKVRPWSVVVTSGSGATQRHAEFTPSWHGLAQTHFPPWPRKTVWHSDISTKDHFRMACAPPNGLAAPFLFHGAQATPNRCGQHQPSAGHQQTRGEGHAEGQTVQNCVFTVRRHCDLSHLSHWSVFAANAERPKVHVCRSSVLPEVQSATIAVDELEWAKVFFATIIH